MSYKIDDNILSVEGNKTEFPYKISEIIKTSNIYIILLEVPIGIDDTDNIYGVDCNGKKLWKIENPTISFKIDPSEQGYNYYLNSIYVQILEINGELRANTFFGMQYTINPQNGKLIKIDVTK